MPITDSGPCRSLIPVMPITESGDADRLQGAEATL
jgi:hypothetical protein